MASSTKLPATCLNHLVQLANQLSDTYLERLIELLILLLGARQLPPIQPGQSEPAEETHSLRGNSRIEFKYIPDSRGFGAVYGPYKYLRFVQGKRHRSLYLGKVELGETEN